jgi:hypothetical protein
VTLPPRPAARLVRASNARRGTIELKVAGKTVDKARLRSIQVPDALIDCWAPIKLRLSIGDGVRRITALPGLMTPITRE